MTENLWNRSAEAFDELPLRRQLISSFDLLYESAAFAVASSVNENPRIIDLGAGTGLLAAAVLAEIPNADIILFDESEGMIGKAVQRFVGQGNVQTMIGDMTVSFPEGPFDAIISALAIHHLGHDQKKQLFSRIHESLLAGGIFVNVEQVLAPSPELELMYHQKHERHVVESHAPAEEWAASRERSLHDICIDLGTQLNWLREAGFHEVDCLAKDWRFTTYAAWKQR
ncbi:MAG: tRNA (cmo5U34)-methyltransferase [Acidimicrobiaceae bacterium]